jgi:tetratricopeptide (TPR) repeat protein
MNLNGIRKQFFNANNLILCFGLTIFLLAGSINNSFKKPALKLSKQQTAININKELLIFLSAGNRRLVTDLLWVQTLLESDLEHYRNRDLNSWMYLRFLTISYLDPEFYQNYLYGGQYLSIVKDDLEGSVDIFQRGLLAYPEDYSLRFHLGFTYYFEMGDYENGAFHLKQIVHHPKAPHFLKVIVNKINFELEKDYNLSLAFIEDVIKKTADEQFLKKLQIDYYALKAERDLICLNSLASNCERLDADGKPYFFLKGKYRSVKKFVPYRLKKKGDQSISDPVDTI